MTAKQPFYQGPIRSTWKIFGPRSRQMTVAIVMKLVQSIFMGMPVGVVAWVVNLIREDTFTTTHAWQAIAVIVAAVIGQYITGLISNYYSWTTTFLAIGDARIRALHHIQRLSLGVAGDRRTGDISAVLTTDYEMVSEFAHYAMPVIFGAIALPIVLAIGLAFIDLPLAGAVLISIVVAVPTFRWTNNRLADLMHERADRVATTNTRVVEYINGIGVARAYNQVGRRLKSYRTAVGDLREINDRATVRLVPLALLSMAIAMLGIPITVAAVAYRFGGGLIDAGTAVIFLVLVLRVYLPLLQVAVTVESLRLGDSSLKRIGSIMDLEEQAQPETPVVAPESAEVELDHVSFGYTDDQLVLEDISFTAKPGTMTALVGASGTGKTTILNLIARFWDADSGTVTIGGADVTQLTSDQLFDAITVVFQDVYLFQGTIRDNIAFGRIDASDADIEAAARAAQAHDFITALPDGYNTRIGEAGGTLSGGERQRISIARAILKDAPIVLLDEPSASVDPLNEQALHLALSELVRNKTLIVVAHRLSTISSADQILVLSKTDGPARLVERGTHDELVALDGVYAHQWRERFRASQWRIASRA